MKTNELNGEQEGAGTEETFSFDFKGLLHCLLRQLWLVALLGAIAGVIAYRYVERLPSFHRSTAVIQIEQKEYKAIEVADNSQQDLRYPDLLETITQNFRNRSLMERVSAALNLAKDPAFLGGTPQRPVPEEAAVNLLQAGASASVRPKTRLMDVTYMHADPRIAQRVAHAMVTEFLKQRVEQRYGALEAQNAVLVKKSEQLREKLEHSEKKLQAYKEEMATVSLEDRRNLVDAKLTALNGDFSAAKSDRIRLESDLRTLEKAGPKEEALLAIASVAQDPEVVTAREKVAALETELFSLTQRYREKHPKMMEARSQFANLRTNLSLAIQSSPKRIEGLFNTAADREKSLQAAVAEQEKAVLELDQKMIPFRVLKRDVESDRVLYDAIVQKLKESTLTMDIEPVAFRIVEPALHAVPMPNQRLLILIGGVLGGCALGLGFIVIRFLIDSSLRTVDDAERILNLPVLAAVPSLGRTKTVAEMLSLLAKPDSAAAESFRTLRAALSLVGPAAEQKVFMVTSAVPAEGKSFTASNLAVAFAQAGLNTLIIDADLRRPALTKLFGTDPAAPGVAECMTGVTPKFFPTPLENLLFLPAGGRAPNPAELLANNRFAELVRNMSEHFDRIVIDTAPVNVVSDTLGILSCASAVCLVVEAGGTSRRVVRRAVELLRRANVRPAGVVLNRMPKWNGVAYHYYYSSNSKYGGDDTYSGAGYGGGGSGPTPVCAPPQMAVAKIAQRVGPQ